MYVFVYALTRALEKRKVEGQEVIVKISHSSFDPDLVRNGGQISRETLRI